MKTVGIAGGGQLGRMLTDAAHVLGHKVIVMDPTPNAPAVQVADDSILAGYADAEGTRQLAQRCDVLTFELEAVNAEVLEELSKNGFPVHPMPSTLALIKDKFKQKTFLKERGIPVGPFADLDYTTQNKSRFHLDIGYPYVLKARSGGFDGRGNALVEKESDLPAALEKIKNAPAYTEGFVKFDKELAIVAARTTAGEIRVYPLVETIHKDNICHMTLAPASVSDAVAQKAHAVTEKVLQSFEGAGVFAIEMFLVSDEVLVNEIAPRVHNSGHWTIEGCVTSQFEQHIRAITGMPLGDTAMKAPAAVMINILGERDGAAEPKGVAEAEIIPGVKVHIYGKMETRKQRKMGHLTALGDSLEEAKEKAERAKALISI